MSQPFIGEIRAFGFDFPPVNWTYCNGQLLPISQFDALYAVIGTIYGGDGQSTFAVPNLQGQVPMHWGNGAGGFTTVIGQTQGVSTVTLTQAQTPTHTHTITVTYVPSGGIVERTDVPNTASFLADSTPSGVWANTSPTFTAPFAGQVLSQVGGSQPHENMQPYLAINFCMATAGIFPSRN